MADSVNEQDRDIDLMRDLLDAELEKLQQALSESDRPT